MTEIRNSWNEGFQKLRCNTDPIINAISLLHEIIYDDQVKLEANPEYHNHVLKLYLLTQYELKNYRFLKSEIKKIKQSMMENGSFGKFEEYFFQMISQLISSRYSGQKEKVFDRFYDRLLDNISENVNEEKVEYQMITDWIQAKLELIES